MIHELSVFIPISYPLQGIIALKPKKFKGFFYEKTASANVAKAAFQKIRFLLVLYRRLKHYAEM